MNKIEKNGTVTGFELETSMTVYKRFIHYATDTSLWLVHVCAYNILNIIKYIYHMTSRLGVK